tara:strand:- start:1138 stop:2406 length:1269 start_codon:yes stop_codon:yes gene_type:complete
MLVMGFGQRASKFNELGRIISIRPNSGTPMTEEKSFEIQSIGQPASVIHARDPIFMPGTETALESDALFFMPTESYNANGVPQYTQLVINEGFVNPLKVSEYNEYFTITKPGTMSTGVVSSSGDGSVAIAPRAATIPQTYRREGLVQVFLTTSPDADSEVAYSDDGVNWCSMTIIQYSSNRTGSAYSSATKFENFPKYLVGAGASLIIRRLVGNSLTVSSISATGSNSYNTSGIYRSKVVPFLRDQSGVQYFLKTNVTFSGASVNSSASDNGTISGSFGGVTFPEGYNEHTDGDDPVYKSIPNSNRFIVSVKVNGVSETITDSERADTTNGFSKTFTDISGNKSIEAVFGYKTVASKTGTDAASQTISPTGNIYRAEGDSIDFTFSETPASITYDGVAQTVNGTTFTLDSIIANANFVVEFT